MTMRKIVLAPEALFQEIGGEAVILDLASSTYFGLDPVGTRLWQLLQEEKNLDQIYPILLQEFEVEDKQLEQDVESFLQQLIDAGLATLE
jgi:hypothetical protein